MLQQSGKNTVSVWIAHLAKAPCLERKKTRRDHGEKEANRIQEDKSIYELLANVCKTKLLNNTGEGAKLPLELELKHFSPSPSQAEMKAFLKVRSGDKRTVLVQWADQSILDT